MMNTIGAPGEQIGFARAPYLQYEKILLTKKFRQNLETTMLSPKVLRMGIQNTPYQKRYKLKGGSQESTVNFKTYNRQFDCLEISLLFNKSHKHLIIYDSYNAECAARMIEKLNYQTFPTRTAQ